jgi:tetraacyldisaccharide 4'-kinase
MRFLFKNLILAPLAFLYGLVVFVRNKCFDFGLIKGEKFTLPVISVGNITIGGTGKTPHTEYLINLLQKENLKVAMVSRGYRRRTKGLVVANENSTARDIGDEPYQMLRKFPHIAIAVDAKRKRAIDFLQKKDSAIQAVVLDDAYQHRYVVAGVSILLINYNRLIYNDRILPYGRLREPAEECDRADIIIVTKCPQNLQPIDLRLINTNLKVKPHQRLYFSTFEYEEIYPVFSSVENQWNMAKLQEVKAGVLIVTGIVSANELYHYVEEKLGYYEKMRFRDHHRFSKKDIARIALKFNNMTQKYKFILVSEKDAARLLSDVAFPENLKPYVYTIPIKVKFLLDQQEMFNKQIMDYVIKNKRNGRFS